MKKYFQISAFAALTIGLSGCVGSGGASMNTGQRLTERGGQITHYGDEWSAGYKIVRDGRKLSAKSADRIADANKKIARAAADQVKARQMIAAGISRMRSAEADYAAEHAGPSAIIVQQPG